MTDNKPAVSPLPPLDPDAIRRRARKATAGPWTLVDRAEGDTPRDVARPMYAPSWWVWQQSRLPYWGGVATQQFREKTDGPGAIMEIVTADGGTIEPLEQDYSDAQFIAHAREDIPALLSHIDALLARALTPEEAEIAARALRFHHAKFGTTYETLTAKLAQIAGDR
jgi:hypothetical protein